MTPTSRTDCSPSRYTVGCKSLRVLAATGWRGPSQSYSRQYKVVARRSVRATHGDSSPERRCRSVWGRGRKRFYDDPSPLCRAGVADRRFTSGLEYRSRRPPPLPRVPSRSPTDGSFSNKDSGESCVVNDIFDNRLNGSKNPYLLRLRSLILEETVPGWGRTSRPVSRQWTEK